MSWPWCNQFNTIKQEILESIERLRMEHRVASEELTLRTQVTTLKKEISDLKIDKARIKEEQDIRERELTHMIGLERKRQQFEIDQAKRETTVQVREENLVADRARFTEQMAFHDKRFTTEVEYLKTIMTEILGRLPTVTIDRAVTPPTEKARR